ncbi:Crp/Fnr family transcriptional regulator [Zunongwangia sp. HRR-M8]|uniref:Crp/Fnr family transcriptional regulator n=1 Tax=Zunongwangia sp. HRR-M8 TaxID=3015170 RepID=UPI0022DE3F55|nr:Crp/Fnr family transcriptional regulator [Zunongwangia sp. HRR-M8]WBL23950.1 Crp/Fnr family transcriptional regulator [Zunongwangia sp. HRR-M8]
MSQPILDHVSKIIDLTEEEKAEFLSILTPVKHAKKDLLIRDGEFVHHNYFVVKGCLRAFYRDDFENEANLQFAMEDWWISDYEALLEGIPARLNVECLEDCELIAIHRDAQEELYRRIPKFERFFRIKVTKSFIALRCRIMSSLQKSSKERYLEFYDRFPELENRIANYHIANYLGIKPESLSRIRKELI